MGVSCHQGPRLTSLFYETFATLLTAGLTCDSCLLVIIGRRYNMMNVAASEVAEICVGAALTVKR